MPRRQDQPELPEAGTGQAIVATDRGTESSIEVQSPDTVVEAGGMSLLKAVRALGPARGGRTREAKTSRLAYQDSIAVLLFVVLLSAAIELVLVDIVLSVLWMRLLALTLGLLAVFGMLAFIVALRAYPHRVANGALTIHYGACFELSVPLESMAAVTERKAMTTQTRIAEVTDGVLSVPVMGVTNLAVTLDSPIRVRLRKTGVAVVREIRVFAVDPGSGALALRNGGLPGHEDASAARPRQRPLWARALRWVGPVVLLAEIALVTTGLLDWRVAAVVIVVTEALLTVFGVAALAALVTQYRRSRACGQSRTDSLTEAIFFLMPVAMAGMVRKEMSFFRVLALAVARRTEGEQPGDVLLAHGGLSRKALTGLAVVLLASGATVLVAPTASISWTALGILLLYAAVVTTSVALASKVRPHVLRGDTLLVRWGLHQDLAIPLGSVRAVEVGQRQRGRRRADTEAADRFAARASGRELIVITLTEPIAVPARFGRQRPADTIIVPVDDAGTAAATLAACTIHAGERR